MNPRCRQVANSVLFLVPAFSQTMAHVSAQDWIGTFTDPGPVLGLESPYEDASPSISTDGLEIFFASAGRPDGLGGRDIYVARRSSREASFGPPVPLPPPVNSSSHDRSPNISHDGLTLYFTSERDGGYGDCDMYEVKVTRSASGEPVGFGNLKNLGEPVNTTGFETDANPSPDELTLYFASDRPGTHGDRDLWMASRSTKDEPFGQVVNLGDKVNTAFQESYPSISADELTLFFSSNNRTRPHDVYLYHLWVTWRPDKDSDFGPATNLVDFGVPAECAVWTPSISADWPVRGSKLYAGAQCTLEGWGQIAEATFVPHSEFVRGDDNADGALDISDAITTLMVLFLGEGQFPCRDAADSNDDGVVDLSDAVGTLGVLFLGEGEMPPPGSSHCGPDPTMDELDCTAYPHCE